MFAKDVELQWFYQKIINMETEELGVITEVGFGMRDCNSPVLWMSIALYAGGFLSVMNSAEACKFIMANDIYDISELKGRAVRVKSEDRIYKVKKLFKY